jgi:hypothetical protein
MASISTPVWPVVSHTTSIETPSSESSSEAVTCVSASGWQSGSRAGVCFEPVIAATLELDDDGVAIEVVCETTGQTGVEMEAMTACAVAALCVYDMTKGIDATGQIESVVLLEKEGGKSGHWVRP